MRYTIGQRDRRQSISQCVDRDRRVCDKRLKVPDVRSLFILEVTLLRMKTSTALACGQRSPRANREPGHREMKQGGGKMEYIRIEKALTRLVGDPEQMGRFYQTAGSFEQTLEDKTLQPRQKAAKIAAIIESGIAKKPNAK
jgi:hypothetical protein